MKIYFNGNEHQIVADMKVSTFLQEGNIHLGCAALAINREFVSRSCYAERTLQEGDRVECVTPMQGG
ncbi:MAG: thiamine biosynthesis protein ThiS [Gammaproteobacteria bacterium RIFCSPHIGHO2_12_FULL_41_15]|nr:MAG: thiamine biosynthesis protein ThiS [Gammaproteobacteria bacterium RIFCSPHIGHO2_12_FULL_41_15]